MKRREIIEAVKKIILKHCKPERIYLFGSSIDPDTKAPADIDIAYDCDGDHSLFLIQEEIKELPSLVKVDLVNLASCGDRFRNRVKDTGKVIWSSTKLLRFEDALLNYEHAYNRFAQIIEREDHYKEDGYGDVYLDVAVKRFEFTFEMAWKCCKRTLDYLGFKCISPRDCLREAFAQKMLSEERIWIEMLEQRNLSAHIYNELNIEEIKSDLKEYAKQFDQLLKELKKMFEKESN